MSKYILALIPLLILSGCQHRGAPERYQTGTVSDGFVPTWDSTDPTTRQTGIVSDPHHRLGPANSAGVGGE